MIKMESGNRINLVNIRLKDYSILKFLPFISFQVFLTF